MAVYLIADVKVTDDGWIPDYAARAHDIMKRHGGRYLARSANITILAGEERDTTFLAIAEFPSMEALRAFLADPDYAKRGAALRAGSISSFRVIDDTDFAGTIPYLKKP